MLIQEVNKKSLGTCRSRIVYLESVEFSSLLIKEYIRYLHKDNG